MTLHLADQHPVSVVAALHCAGHSAPLVGGVACGACWERAIRDDERFAVENGLLRALDRDADLIDDVAVERAMLGHRVALTRAERRTAMSRLHDARVRPGDIARLLRMSHSTVVRELDRLAQLATSARGAA